MIDLAGRWLPLGRQDPASLLRQSHPPLPSHLWLRSVQLHPGDLLAPLLLSIPLRLVAPPRLSHPSIPLDLGSRLRPLVLWHLSRP